VCAYLVSDASRFDRIRADAEQAFDLRSALPGPVCRIPDVRTLWFEDAVVASGDFWPALQTLARLHGDPAVGLLALDPDPVDYYYANFKLYGALSLPTASSAADYWDALTEAPPGCEAAAIRYNADRWVAFGQSRRWGVWYERDGVELAAVFSAIVPGLAAWRTALTDTPLEIEDAQDIIRLATGREVPDVVVHALRDNWGHGI
jgi:hypothetical protein